MEIVGGVTAVWKAVADAVAIQGANLLDYATVLAAIGTLAMAIVEMLKSVTHAPLWFNKWRVSEWTGDTKGSGIGACFAGSRSNPVLAELLLLAVGGAKHWRSLFDQPVEKMMGQIQAAANVALEYPNEYPHLYRWLTTVPEAYWKRGCGANTRCSASPHRWGAANVPRRRTSTIWRSSGLRSGPSSRRSTTHCSRGSSAVAAAAASPARF